MEHYILDEIKEMPIVGIYRIIYPNGKAYIGQSQNIYKRILEHNQRAKKGAHGNKEIQLCEKAIAKYGKVNEIDILERCAIEVLDEREKYWISQFHTDNSQYGYNLLDKGDVSGRRGCDHPEAAFSEMQLKEVIDLLLNHTELSLIDIANKYGVTQDTILRISTGKSYINPDLIYPLRRNNHDSTKKNKVEDYFSSLQELLDLKEELKYSWWLRIENGDLCNKYHISKKVLLAINHGRLFEDIGNYIYPIRKFNAKIDFTKEDILQILDLLRNTSESMTNIGKRYRIGRDLVSKINTGKSYIIKNYDYPARK